MSKPSTSKSKKKEFYVNPKEFYNEIKTFYETDDLVDSLAESVNKIAIGLSYATNFIIIHIRMKWSGML